MDVFFVPRTQDEVSGQGRVYHTVPGLSGFCIELEAKVNAYAGLLPNGKPFYWDSILVINTIHKTLQVSRSVKGMGMEASKEILTYGVARTPPFGPGQPQYGNPFLMQTQVPPRIDEHGNPVKPKKHWWSRGKE